MRLRGLYVITDRHLAGGRDHEEVISAALAGGARIIQLRDKELGRAELLETARRLANLCVQAGALFVVNDDPSLAAEAGAGGVHLGPSDASPAAAREVLGQEAIVGWSVKGSLELARQAAGSTVSYVAVGSIFPTSTKAGAVVVGLPAIAAIREVCPLPIAAIGGVTAANARSVAAAGADMVCVISAAVAATDVENACRRLAREIEAGLADRDG